MSEADGSSPTAGIAKLLQTLDEGMKDQLPQKRGFFDPPTRIEMARYTITTLACQAAIMSAVKAIRDGEDPLKHLNEATDMLAECAAGAARLSGIDGLAEAMVEQGWSMDNG